MDAYHRSTEAPMDFQFTSRPSSGTKPVWAASAEDSNIPRKRPRTEGFGSFNDLNSAPTTSALPFTPIFGENLNTRFNFLCPPPQTNPPSTWAPPSGFSPQRAFPHPSTPEPRDVTMSVSNPPKTKGEKENGRTGETGGRRRTYKSRQKGRALPSHPGEDDDLEQTSEDDGIPLAQNTSNHFTVNMSSSPAPQSGIPYILLGYVQLFFNLALKLVFLYLLVQLILAIRHDVRQRILEYSMNIVLEITDCASQYKNNYCETNQIPAMTLQCAAWKACMNRDPATVGRVRIFAELIAEAVNSFVEPMSWKTLGLLCLTLLMNMLLRLCGPRNRSRS